MPASSRLSTGLGFLSILLWSTSIAMGRLVMNDVGVLLGPFILSLASGGIGTAITLARPGGAARLAALPRRYWLVCGGLFLLYMLSYNLGVGLAADRRQVLAFGILNYLWPVLTLVFSAAFSRLRVRPWLAAGVLLAAAGIALAMLSRQEAGAGLAGFLADARSHPAVYVLGLVCGVSWGLYSAMGRKLAGASEANPVPILFLGMALVYGVLLLSGAGRLLGKPAAAPAALWSGTAIAALAWRALVADLLSYVCWDAAMRRGNQILVAAASFFTPLLSTACIAALLRVAPGLQFWAACALLVAGAAVSRLSVSGER